MSKDFSTSIMVDKSPSEVFEAVQDVRDWWSKDITGNTANEGDVFEFEVPGVHYSKQKLTEVVLDKKIVWTVLEANMTFIKQSDEWKNTKIVFDIEKLDDGKTKLTFTHIGLTPEVECYEACMPAWTEYVKHSLFQKIQTGSGDPNLEGKSIEKPKNLQ